MDEGLPENEDFCEMDDLYEEYELPRSPSGSCSSQSEALDLSEILDEQKKLISLEATGLMMLPQQNEMTLSDTQHWEEPFLELQSSKDDAMESQSTLKSNNLQSFGPSTSLQFVKTENTKEDSWELYIEKAMQHYPDLDKIQNCNLLPDVPNKIFNCSSDVENINAINIHYDQIKSNQKKIEVGTVKTNSYFKVVAKTHSKESEASQTLSIQSDTNKAKNLVKMKTKHEIIEDQACDQMQIPVNNFDIKRNLHEQGETIILDDTPAPDVLGIQIKESITDSKIPKDNAKTNILQENQDNCEEADKQIDTQVGLEIAGLEALGMDIEVPVQNKELNCNEEKIEKKAIQQKITPLNEISKCCEDSTDVISMAQASINLLEEENTIDTQDSQEINELEALGMEIEVPVQDKELNCNEEEIEENGGQQNITPLNEISKCCEDSTDVIKMAQANTNLLEENIEENTIDTQDSQEINELEALGMEIEVPVQEIVIESVTDEFQRIIQEDQDSTEVEATKCFLSAYKMTESYEVKLNEEAQVETKLVEENSGEEKFDTQDLHEIEELEELGLNVVVPVQEIHSQDTKQGDSDRAQNELKFGQSTIDQNKQISVTSKLLDESCEELTQKIQNPLQAEDDEQEQPFQSNIKDKSTTETHNTLLTSQCETKQSAINMSVGKTSKQNFIQENGTLTEENLTEHNRDTQVEEAPEVQDLSQKIIETFEDGENKAANNSGNIWTYPSNFNKDSDWMCDALSNSACDSTPTQENDSQIISPIVIEGLPEDSVTADSGVAGDDSVFPDETSHSSEFDLMADDMDYVDDFEYDDRDPYLTPSQHPSQVSQQTNNSESQAENPLSLSNSPKDQELKAIAEMLIPNQPFLPFGKIRLAADAPETEATLPDESVLSEMSSNEATLPDHLSAALPSKSSTVIESSITLTTETKAPLRVVKSLFTQTDIIPTYSIYTQTSPQTDVKMDYELQPGKRRGVGSTGPSAKLACLPEGLPTARKSARKGSVNGGSLGQDVPPGEPLQPVRQSLRIGLSRRAKLNTLLHKN